MSRASIGDYVVTSKLGSGSFAIVYKGYHKVTKVPVAIKAMSLAKLNAKLLANLETEIAIMRQIDHPNVVKLYEIKKTEKHMYLMLEYCAGGDLQQYMRRQTQQTGQSTLPEDVARHFLRELAKGMKCLWTHNLIHRDLKPQNLLLLEDSATSTLKIADFGFARHLASTSGELAETLCGSPLYMAPEILKFQKYDAKADLWSVGTILFEMVTGKPPYGGSNHMQLLANIERSTGLRFPTDVAISEDCRQLLLGLLQRRAVHRISFDEFFRAPFVGLDQDGNSPSMVMMMSTTMATTMATSIREEDEEDEEEEETKKPRAVSESNVMTTTTTPTTPTPTTTTPTTTTPTMSMRSSRSGNMEVLQNVFGSTSSTGSTSMMRRSSRLTRSRRATSSGAILVNQTSPKLSPQMSPDVLPSPGPRINPFKELSDSPPSRTVSPAPPLGARVVVTPKTTHASLVKQKHGTDQTGIDSSGEYVLVESGDQASSSPPTKTPTNMASPRTEPSPRAVATVSTTAVSTAQTQPVMTVSFSHEYAQQLVEIVNLRTQAIAPIADHLWKMSAQQQPHASGGGSSGSGTNLASMFSLSSSTSSSLAGQTQLIAGVAGSNGGLESDASSVMDKKQYVYAAEALALYVKCMRMIQHALVYLRQDPAMSKQLGSGSSPTSSPVPLSETSRKIAMAYLVEQLNVFLERADQCKKRMAGASGASDELRALVISQEELLYTHAIRLGKEGAIKEVLGQSRAAYELYLQAMLLLESLLMDSPLTTRADDQSPPTTLTTSMTMDDQKRVGSFVKALEERLHVVKQHVADGSDHQKQQPYAPALARPGPLARPLTTSPMAP